MSKAIEESMKAFPKRKDGRLRGYYCTDDDIRGVYSKGYRKATKNIIFLIESRIAEILGDAQPAPVLRIELQELIDKIKEESK